MRTTWLGGCVLAAAGVAGAQEAAPAKPPLDAAIEAFGKGEYAKAAEVAATVPADAPERPKAAYLVGEARAALGEWAPAEAAFREVLAARPKAVPALVGLGRACSQQGKVEEAVKTLEQAAKGDRKDPQPLAALAAHYLRAGKAPEALARAEAAAKLAPKDPGVIRTLAEAMLASEQIDRALALADRLVKDLPEHPMGHFLRGCALDRNGKDPEAIAAYEAALGKDDRFLDAHKNLAILCHAKNPLYKDRERTRKALAHYKRYFDLGGKDEALQKIYDMMRGFLLQMDPSLGE